MSDHPEPADVFREEAVELLEELESSLMRLADDPAHTESLHAAFRALHTIKGSGAMFDFDELVDVAHRLEAFFVVLRDRGGAVPEGVADAGLAAVDLLRAIIADDGGEGQRAVLADSLQRRFAELVGPVGNGGADATAAPPGERRGGPTPDAADSSAPPAAWELSYIPSPQAFLDGTNLPGIISELQDLGATELHCELPASLSIEQCDPESCHLRWHAMLPGDCSRQDILDVFMFIDEESSLTIEPRPASHTPEASVGDTPSGSDRDRSGPPSPSVEIGSGAELSGGVEAASIKVRTDRLDRLVNLVGELVSLQGQMTLRATELADRSLLGYTEQLERLVREARSLSMDMHMVPVERLFGPFRRHVRSLAKELGREVRLLVAGNDTELDRNVVDQLRDPLLHVIRNAIDHGIEPPEDREAAGKPRRGTLRLSADYAGALVRIRVQDDGRGIDRERILARARERGLVAEDAEPTQEQIAELVFAPGFSTATTATAVSGRGVGMDVVRRNMEGLGGSVALRDAAGGGTLVEMRIPLTLAIVEGLLAEVGDNLFMVKLEYIRECREDADGADMLNVRGGLVPVVRLADFFDIDTGTGAEGATHREQDAAVIVVEAQDQWLGLRVDRLIGTQQSVVKPLGALLSGVEGVSGAIFLSDGRPGLLLDIERLSESSRRRGRPPDGARSLAN